MADYWKSNAKKYCEFCKVWIADNKASVNIHESGRKHKDAVKAKLFSVT
jgi:WW domain-binding protein 4